MSLVIRQGHGRRSYPSVEFPLKDCQGRSVDNDRRRLSDRRKVEHEIGDLKVMLVQQFINKSA